MKRKTKVKTSPTTSSNTSKEGVGEFYAVEKIIDKQPGDDGEILYEVKWVGYTEEHNTWEPVENL